MGQNYTELITEVQQEVGKIDDDVDATNARVGRYVNWAQQEIVRRWPGLRDANVLDKTSIACVTDQYEYDLATLLAAKPLAHIILIRYIDTSGENYRRILPFKGGVEQFDEDYPYPPNYETGIPRDYIRRANTLELIPVPTSVENAKPLWLEYTRRPYDMVAASTVAASTGGADRADNVVTITTTTAHGFGVGDRVDVAVTTVASGVSFNGEFVIVSVPSTTTFTYASTGAASTGGAGTITHLPLLTDFDEEIIQVAVWRAMMMLGRTNEKLMVLTQGQGIFAWDLVETRVDGEADFDEDDQMVNE